MTAFAKIKAGRVNSLDFSQYVGEVGHLFYNVDTGEIRISDGYTVGGNPISITASTINTASFLPDLDDTYGLGDPYHRWNHIHVGSGGIYLDGAEGSQGYTLDVNTSTHTLEYIGGTGNIAVGGITFPDTSRQTVAFEPTAIPQSIIPKTTDIYDLGSYSHRWANVYIGPHSLHIVDQQTLQDISITVENGTLLLSGVQNLAVGNLVIHNTTLETVTPDLNIYVGSANDTGDAVIGRQLYVNNYNYPSNQALLTLNASNQTAPVNQFPYTIVETVSRQDYNSRIIQRSYGTTSGLGVEGVYSVFGGYSARGTATAPAQTKSGDIILRMSGQGYAANVGFVSTGGARIDFKATQDFTDTAKGTSIDFWTTPVNSNVVTNSASINNTGFVGNAFTFNTDGSTQTIAGIPYTAKGNPNASLVATLGIDGRLDISQIPTSLTGAVVFKGGWDAGNNNPVLSDGSGVTGWEYIVTTGGTANLGTSSVTYAPGDYVVYGGNVWLYVQGVSPFTSLTGGQHITVSSPTGAMTLGSDATPNYTTGTIVSRDGSGSFSANQITANLLGTATSALTAGTVTNPVQTAITKVGNLGNLTVIGNITAAYVSGQLTTTNQPQITTIGTLGNLTVSGTIAGNINGSATTAQTVTSSSQPVITSVGNLTSLVVTGNITAQNSIRVANTVSASTFIGNIISNGSSRFGPAYSGYDYPGAVVQIFDNKAGYSQLINMNYSNSNTASTDFVAQNNLGSDAFHYIDMGINSSTYDGTSIGWTISGANDSYLYANAGSLTIGTDTANKIIKFHTGGVGSANIRANITDAGMNVIGNVSANYYIGNGWYLASVAKSYDIAGANAAISVLSNSITGANAAISGLSNSITGANASIAGANAAISSLANNITGANASISTLYNNLAGANAAISVLSNSIAGANAVISGHTSSINNINGNIAGANAAISGLTNSLAGANAAISTNANNITGANATISGLTNSIAGANAAISGLSNSITGANATISQHTNSIANINANIAGANAAINTITNNLAGANAAISTNANNITGANAAILVLQGQVYANANVATYLPSYNGNIRAAYITVTNTSTLGNITITGSNIYSTATNVDLNLGQLTATANLNINRTTVHNKDVTVNGNVALSANSKLTLPKMVYNYGGVRTIAGGTPTVTLNFDTDSIVTIWQPAGTVTLQYGTLVAGSSITVLINLATKRAIVLGVSGTNNSSTASTSLQNGAGTPGLVNNQLVSLVYTCTDGTAANTYVSCSYV